MATKTAKTEVSTMSEAEIVAMLTKKKVAAAEEISAPVIEKKTASRAGWTGTLSVGLLTFGVKSYTATEQNKLSFNNLHADCKSKMNNVSHCHSCEAKAATPLTPEQIAAGEVQYVYNPAKISGYEYSKGEFITVTEEELTACEPASDKAMTVSEFVPAAQVDPIYFEKTYFLSPDDKDKNAAKYFGLVRATMVAKSRVGIVTFATRGRQNTAVIRPYTMDGVKGLLLHYMFYEAEIRNFDGWNNVPDQFEADELELAGLLMDKLSNDFNSTKHFDSYDANVRKLVASKIDSNVPAPVVTKAPEPVATNNLMDMLRKSISMAK
jgi:DNA end-binding protein Ku